MSALRGKVIWVTGAGSGVGEGTMKHVAVQGAKVAALARRADRAIGLT